MAQPKGTRINGVMLASVLIVASLVLRLAFLQVIQGDHHATLARNNMERAVIKPAPRGLILDSNLATIARNEYRYEIGLQVRPNQDWETTFDFLADYFEWEDEPRDEDDESISLKQRKYNTVKNHRRYQETVILETRMTREQMLELEEERWRYPILDIIQRPVRHYDEGALFPQLVQGMNSDGTTRGSSLELAWDEYLRGKDGYDIWGVNVRSVPVELIRSDEAEPGNNIVLTLDMEFQKYVQKVLAEGIEANQVNQINRGAFPPGRHGAAIVLDVRTGDILAIASYPDFDVTEMYTTVGDKLKEVDHELNKHLRTSLPASSTSSQYRFNPLWTGTGAFGPGSTIKVLTSIIALEEGVITPNQRYQDKGSYGTSRENAINNANNRVWGSVNLKEAITVSLNSYFGWMVDNLSSSILGNITIIRNYANLFGLNGDTGFVDVPDQNKVGQIFPVGGPQSPLQFTIGANSTVHVSPMHMANFVSMVANKGYHYRPRLVKQITDSEGNVIEDFEPEIYRSVPHDVVSEETYDIVIDAMKSVTKYGTRFNGTSAAAFVGFPIEVAAKSGTAAASGSREDAHSWWMGFAPANEPEIAVVVFTEHGGMNAHTHHITRKIMDEYFGFNEPEEINEVDDLEDTDN